MFKHGEKIYKYSWFVGYKKLTGFAFRFRYDPVPGIRKYNWHFSNFYKTPKTTNERRQWYASEGYGRGKRGPRYLANSWDDYPRADRYFDSSWKKNKIRKQWMKNV